MESLKLRMLLEHHELQSLVNRYACGLDRIDSELLKSAHFCDGTVDLISF